MAGLILVMQDNPTNWIIWQTVTLSGLGYFRLILDWRGEINPPGFFALGTSHGHVNYVYYNILRKSFSSREDIKGLPIVPIDGAEHLNIILRET